MKGGEQIALANQGGNTLVNIGKAVNEMKDQTMIVNMNTNIM